VGIKKFISSRRAQIIKQKKPVDGQKYLPKLDTPLDVVLDSYIISQIFIKKETKT